LKHAQDLIRAPSQISSVSSETTSSFCTPASDLCQVQVVSSMDFIIIQVSRSN